MDIKFLIPILILQLILTLVALIDVIRRDQSEVKGKKVYWILLILLGSTLGSIIYLFCGRRNY